MSGRPGRSVFKPADAQDRVRYRQENPVLHPVFPPAVHQGQEGQTEREDGHRHRRRGRYPLQHQEARGQV